MTAMVSVYVHYDKVVLLCKGVFVNVNETQGKT